MKVNWLFLRQIWDESIFLAIKNVMSQSSTIFDLQSWLMKRTCTDMPANQMLALYCYFNQLTTAALSAAQHQRWHHTAARQRTEWNMWENKVWEQTFLWKREVMSDFSSVWLEKNSSWLEDFHQNN